MFTALVVYEDGQSIWFQKGGQCGNAQNLHFAIWPAGGTKNGCKTVAIRKDHKIHFHIFGWCKSLIGSDVSFVHFGLNLSVIGHKVVGIATV